MNIPEPIAYHHMKRKLKIIKQEAVQLITMKAHLNIKSICRDQNKIPLVVFRFYLKIPEPRVILLLHVDPSQVECKGLKREIPFHFIRKQLLLCK